MNLVPAVKARKRQTCGPSNRFDTGYQRFETPGSSRGFFYWHGGDAEKVFTAVIEGDEVCPRLLGQPVGRGCLESLVDTVLVVIL